MKKIEILDTTLRDGAQSKGVLFSLNDKLNIAKALDNLEITYIEGGNPYSSKSDMEFFKEVKKLGLKNSKISAFSSTRHKNMNILEDESIKALVEADTSVVAIFGKSSVFQAIKILETTKEENLNMIYDTVFYLNSLGKEVIFDAEHFFIGYKEDKDYALKTLEYAVKAGASTVCLCDTTGCDDFIEVGEITKNVIEFINSNNLKCQVGIHTHNDRGLAVASSIMAALNGAVHIQGTFLGIGERTGNADLSSIIPNLELNYNFDVIGRENLEKLTETAGKIAESTNMILNADKPYVGDGAFSHKGGMHIDGILKHKESFEHIDPSIVGNKRKILLSDVAGRSTVLKKIEKIDNTLDKKDEITKDILNNLKDLERQGYHFEEAQESFELLVRKSLGKFKKSFEIVGFKIIGEHTALNENYKSTAMIKVKSGDKVEITAAEGEGPVNALDSAIRKALIVFFPNIKDIVLTDYKVRVIDPQNATASKVRVLITSSDGKNSWSTVGVSRDVIKASFEALIDSIEYKLNIDYERGLLNDIN